MSIKNLNGSNVTFEQDDRISFVESTHKYTVTGIGEMTPVSTIYSKFFQEFDAMYWSMAKSNNDPLEAEKLRDKWAAGGAAASQAGTFMHAVIENYLNGIAPDTLKCVTTYRGKHVQMEQTVDIAREWSFFKAFDKETKYTPFRTEWRVWDGELRMAGTIDLLCSCDDGTYEIYDWKRSNKVDPSEVNNWQSGINGLEHLTDTSYSHYCLQQNLYRYILEKNYGIKIKRMNLVVLHPDYDTYRIVPIPFMDREVKTIVDHVKSHLGK